MVQKDNGPDKGITWEELLSFHDKPNQPSTAAKRDDITQSALNLHRIDFQIPENIKPFIREGAAPIRQSYSPDETFSRMIDGARPAGEIVQSLHLERGSVQHAIVEDLLKKRWEEQKVKREIKKRANVRNIEGEVSFEAENLRHTPPKTDPGRITSTYEQPSFFSKRTLQEAKDSKKRTFLIPKGAVNEMDTRELTWIMSRPRFIKFAKKVLNGDYTVPEGYPGAKNISLLKMAKDIITVADLVEKAEKKGVPKTEKAYTIGVRLPDGRVEGMEFRVDVIKNNRFVSLKFFQGGVPFDDIRLRAELAMHDIISIISKKGNHYDVTRDNKYPFNVKASMFALNDFSLARRPDPHSLLVYPGGIIGKDFNFSQDGREEIDFLITHFINSIENKQR